MFGIGLREHHQFGVGRIAPEFAVTFGEIRNFVGRERKAESCIDRGERDRRLAAQSACARAVPARRYRTATDTVERGDDRLRHRIVQVARDRTPARAFVVGCVIQIERNAALDAAHREAAALQDVGRLARPGRTRAESWHDPERCVGRRAAGRFDDFAKSCEVDVRRGVDEIDVTRRTHAAARRVSRQLGIQTVDAESGQRRLAVEDDHGR